MFDFQLKITLIVQAFADEVEASLITVIDDYVTAVVLEISAWAEELLLTSTVIFFWKSLSELEESEKLSYCSFVRW